MKKILFSAFFMLATFFAAHSQTTVKVGTDGNYYAVRDTTKKVNVGAVNTGKTYTDTKGNTYPLMKSKNGKLFVIRTSAKTGKQYNQYIKVN